jgi:hypothetical protein
MTQQELIAFGKELISKGRTPREIHQTLANKASSKQELKDVLEEVFVDAKPTKKRSTERITTLLAANKLKLNFEYSQRGLIRIAISIIGVGIITYGLSREEVNQNEPFGWVTLAQGTVIATFYGLVRYSGFMQCLLIAVIAYFTMWSLEILILGVPNDLLEVYNHQKIHTPSHKISTNAAGARIIGAAFPYIYLGVKLFLGWFIFDAYRSHKRYDALSEDIKQELKEF